MSEKKWTPGPWRLKTSGNIGNAIEAKCGTWEYGDYYAIVGTFQEAHGLGEDLTHDAERENALANGRLMAAAPELYEALEGILKAVEDSEHWWIDCPDRGGLDVKKIEAAMAKARGEQQ